MARETSIPAFTTAIESVEAPPAAAALDAEQPAGLRRLAGAVRARLAEDRGDVPGWVLITLMTAAIVIGLWAVASEQILQIFENAMAPFLEREL